MQFRNWGNLIRIKKVRRERFRFQIALSCNTPLRLQLVFSTLPLMQKIPRNQTASGDLLFYG